MGYERCPIANVNCPEYSRVPKVEGELNGCFTDKLFLNGFLWRHSLSVNSCKNRADFFAVSFAMPRYAVFYTINFYNFYSFAVEQLFFLSSPTAVLRRIVAIVINSIKAVFSCWFFPHILKKISKLVPRLTNRHAPLTIPVVASVIRVVAPVHHCTPRIIFGFLIKSPTVNIFRVVTALKHFVSETFSTTVASIVSPPAFKRLKNIATIAPDSVRFTDSLYNNKSVFAKHSDIITQRLKYV